jgi:hypothetical protein
LAIRGPSFRWLDAGGTLPRLRRHKPGLALVGLVLTLAGCGGGDDAEPRTVAGPGFTFSAPAGWEPDVRGRSAAATPAAGGTELVSVRVFRLARPFRPELWPSVVPELDRVAEQLAEQLGGRIESSGEVTIAGRRGKRYDIRYVRDGSEVVERTGFVLNGRREYQLVCRFEASRDEGGRRACDLLFSTLRLA